jgi:hypothetical protein
VAPAIDDVAAAGNGLVGPASAYLLDQIELKLDTALSNYFF